MRQNVIAAISTPPGKGGVAIIRMSGDGALEIADKIFISVGGKRLSSYPPRMQVYGYIIYNEEKIDDGLLTYFPAGHSYTGEETVEISCHGGILITRTVLECLFTNGAIPAEAGEFTSRAFINGRLTLTEAEAIGNLLEARSMEQISLSSSPARQRLSGAIDEIRSELVSTMSSIYARIDYPDEDLGEFTDDETVQRLKKTRHSLSRLISTYRTGRAINEGISAVICGKPNVGKSTLYNALLGEEAAIVTEIEGTTRDLLQREISVGRVILRLTDTAGIRESESADRVEKIGIERTKDAMRGSELLLVLFDTSRPLDEYDALIIDELRNIDMPKICILNKTDAATDAFDTSALGECNFNEIIRISAKNDDGAAAELLGEIINKLFTDESIVTREDAIVSSARQHSALCRCLSLIDTAISAYEAGLPADAASSDVEMAIGAISEVDGRSVSEAVVNDIFSKFCVGK